VIRHLQFQPYPLPDVLVVVEDSSMTGEVVRAVLTADGYRVLEAADGRKGP
jgi:DNA-binding response OmpR family regulator